MAVGKLFKRVVIGIGSLIAAIIIIVAATLAIAGLVYARRAHERTAAGTLRTTSLYV